MKRVAIAAGAAVLLASTAALAEYEACMRHCTSEEENGFAYCDRICSGKSAEPQAISGAAAATAIADFAGDHFRGVSDLTVNPVPPQYDAPELFNVGFTLAAGEGRCVGLIQVGQDYRVSFFGSVSV